MRRAASLDSSTVRCSSSTPSMMRALQTSSTSLGRFSSMYSRETVVASSFRSFRPRPIFSQPGIRKLG